MIYILKPTYSNISMRYFILAIFILLSYSSYSQEVELPALRLSDSFSKPYRVLNTTISDESLFDQYYNDTNLTLDSVIRYHFYTSINLNSDQNQLISMDGTKFNLSSKNAKDLTDEIISLVSKMYLGRKEFMDFKKLNKNID
jgi:hypothetical protein|tara:strand:+ start:7379 stop:7804 length:426 start_codon:yes stop_codon:yes gene_type:complete